MYKSDKRPAGETDWMPLPQGGSVPAPVRIETARSAPPKQRPKPKPKPKRVRTDSESEGEASGGDRSSDGEDGDKEKRQGFA